jgi:putative intracellular protease/amidase
MPLPDRDFDVTEVAVPWRLLTRAGHEVVFATELGSVGPVPRCDPRLLTGVLFGGLGAAEEPKAFYRELEKSPELRRSIAWAEIDPRRFDGLVLPGGHAPGMRQYLGAKVLHEKVLAFWQTGKPVGAICHGPIVLARTRDSATGKSVIHDRQTTCLPKYMERGAYLLTFWKLGKYYRTYPEYVEDEVAAALSSRRQLVRGPRVLFARGTAENDRPAFVVEDGRYVSARWPGDAYLFAKRFMSRL